MEDKEKIKLALDEVFKGKIVNRRIIKLIDSNMTVYEFTRAYKIFWGSSYDARLQYLLDEGLIVREKHDGLGSTYRIRKDHR